VTDTGGPRNTCDANRLYVKHSFVLSGGSEENTPHDVIITANPFEILSNIRIYMPRQSYDTLLDLRDELIT
jgi:hypothetical protein